MPTQEELDQLEAERKAKEALANGQASTGSPASSATKDEHMIPKSRLDEVLAKADKAERELLRLKTAEEERKKKEMNENDRLKLEKEEAERKVLLAEQELKAEREKNTAVTEASKVQFGDKEKKYRFIDPEIAFKLLTPEAKEKGVVNALHELAKNYPYLLESYAPPTPGKGGSPGKGKQVELEDVQSRTIDAKRREYGGNL